MGGGHEILQPIAREKSKPGYNARRNLLIGLILFICMHPLACKPEIVEKRVEVEVRATFDRMAENEWLKLLAIRDQYFELLHEIWQHVVITVGDAFYLKIDISNRSASVQIELLKKEVLSTDAVEHLKRRAERVRTLAVAIGNGASDDLSQLKACTNNEQQSQCELTPDNILQALLHFDPGNANTQKLVVQNTRIKNEVKRLLSGKYWTERITQETLTTLRNTFGLKQ